MSLTNDEIEIVSNLSYDIAVVHTHQLAFMVRQETFKNKKLIYIIHQLPTQEPFQPERAFGSVHLYNSIKILCDHSSIIICTSNAEYSKLMKTFGIYKDKIHVINKGVPQQTSWNFVEPSICETRKVFGFFGDLDYRKGLIECVKSFKGIDGELRIANVINDSSYLRRVLDFIEGADLSNRIHFYGSCHKSRKLSFLRSLDALIIPSLYEVSTYLAIEAIAQGIPILCSIRGGLYELISEYKYTFDPYDLGSMKKCIDEFQTDTIDEIRKQFNALMKKIPEFSFEKMQGKYNELFERVYITD